MYNKIKAIIGVSSICCLLTVLILVSCKTSGLSQDKKGFVKIFDGKTLNGWEGDLTYWKAENGSLVGEITPTTLLKTNSFIVWKGGMPGDFELTLDFKITKAGNSGINYRSEYVKDVPYALRGYQADIDGAMMYTGQNYEERGRTTLAYRGQKTTINPQNDPQVQVRSKVKNNAWTDVTVTGSFGTSDALKEKVKSEDWNTLRIVAKGNHLQHYVNDILMSDVTDEDKVFGKSTGSLGMQVHVGPPMRVEYRNIMLKQ